MAPVALDIVQAVHDEQVDEAAQNSANASSDSLIETGLVNLRKRPGARRRRRSFTHCFGRTSWISPTIAAPDEGELIAPRHPLIRGMYAHSPGLWAIPREPTESCRTALLAWPSMGGPSTIAVTIRILGTGRMRPVSSWGRLSAEPHQVTELSDTAALADGCAARDLRFRVAWAGAMAMPASIQAARCSAPPASTGFIP